MPICSFGCCTGRAGRSDEEAQLEIEIINKTDQAKWSSDSVSLHRHVTVEVNSEKQGWVLQKEPSEYSWSLWSFHVPYKHKKLFVTYEDGSDDIRLEYSGLETKRRLFLATLSPRGLVRFKTRDNKKYLSRAGGKLVLVNVGIAAEVIEWSMRLAHLEIFIESFVATVQTGDNFWISSNPGSRKPILVQPSHESQEWNLDIHHGQEGVADVQQTSFAVFQFYTGKYYVSCSGGAEDNTLLLENNSAEIDRKFKALEGSGGRGDIMLVSLAQTENFVSKDDRSDQLQLFSSNILATSWFMTINRWCIGKLYFPPYDETEKDGCE